MKKIFLHIPKMWMGMKNLPGINKFYTNLSQVLKASKYPYKEEYVLGQKGKHLLVNPDPEYIHITHHIPDPRDNIIITKLFYIPYYFYMDPTGYSGWSEMANNPEMFVESQKVDVIAARKFCKELKERYAGNNISKYKQSEKPLDFKFKGKFLFFPAQIVTDAVTKLARVQVLPLLKGLIDSFRNKDLGLVIKRHPFCKKKEVLSTISDAVRRYSNIFVTTSSIHKIIPKASAVVTVNSGVGFESLLYGKPVFTAGKSDYEWVTNSISSLQDVKGVYGKIAKGIQVNKDRVYKFIYYYLNEVLVDVEDTERIAKRLECLIEKY